MNAWNWKLIFAFLLAVADNLGRFSLADAKKNALNSVDQNEVENRRQRRYVPSGRFEIQRPFQGEFPRAYFAGNANISAAIDPRVLTEHQRRIPAIDGVTQSTGGVEHLTGNSELGSEKQSQTGVSKLVQVVPAAVDVSPPYNGDGVPFDSIDETPKTEKASKAAAATEAETVIEEEIKFGHKIGTENSSSSPSDAVTDASFSSLPPTNTLVPVPAEENSMPTEQTDTRTAESTTTTSPTTFTPEAEETTTVSTQQQSTNAETEKTTQTRVTEEIGARVKVIKQAEQLQAEVRTTTPEPSKNPPNEQGIASNNSEKKFETFHTKESGKNDASAPHKGKSNYRDPLDLHNALRMPLHRLTDQQLDQLFLQIRKAIGDRIETIPLAETTNLNRSQKIEILRQMVRFQHHRILRPILLTNINVSPDAAYALHPSSTKVKEAVDAYTRLSASSAALLETNSMAEVVNKTASVNGTISSSTSVGNVTEANGDGASAAQTREYLKKLRRLETAIGNRVAELDERLSRVNREKYRYDIVQRSSKTLAAQQKVNAEGFVNDSDDGGVGAHELEKVSQVLRDVKARYEAIKREFLRKLQQIEQQREKVGRNLMATNGKNEIAAMFEPFNKSASPNGSIDEENANNVTASAGLNATIPDDLQPMENDTNRVVSSSNGTETLASLTTMTDEAFFSNTTMISENRTTENRAESESEQSSTSNASNLQQSELSTTRNGSDFFDAAQEKATTSVIPSGGADDAKGSVEAGEVTNRSQNSNKAMTDSFPPIEIEKFAAENPPSLVNATLAEIEKELSKMIASMTESDGNSSISETEASRQATNKSTENKTSHEQQQQEQQLIMHDGTAVVASSVKQNISLAETGKASDDEQKLRAVIPDDEHPSNTHERTTTESAKVSTKGDRTSADAGEQIESDFEQLAAEKAPENAAPVSARNGATTALNSAVRAQKVTVDRSTESGAAKSQLPRQKGAKARLSPPAKQFADSEQRQRINPSLQNVQQQPAAFHQNSRQPQLSAAPKLGARNKRLEMTLLGKDVTLNDGRRVKLLNTTALGVGVSKQAAATAAAAKTRISHVPTSEQLLERAKQVREEEQRRRAAAENIAQNRVANDEQLQQQFELDGDVSHPSGPTKTGEKQTRTSSKTAELSRNNSGAISEHDRTRIDAQPQRSHGGSGSTPSSSFSGSGSTPASATLNPSDIAASIDDLNTKIVVADDEKKAEAASSGNAATVIGREQIGKNSSKRIETAGGESENDVDEKNLAEFAQIDDQLICDAIYCDFEAGNLCELEASADSLRPSDSAFFKNRRKRVHKRQTAQNKRPNKTADEDLLAALLTPNNVTFVQRTWNNSVGRYRNRLTGIARAGFFSKSNQHFASAYLRPRQVATLTGRLLSGEPETIRFRFWEATRGLQLQVCCDSVEQCVFRTELGVEKGSRRWRGGQAKCPAGTKKVIFECKNLGEQLQGACGLDNIHLHNSFCVSPLAAVAISGQQASPPKVRARVHAATSLAGGRRSKRIQN